jgi:predicted outer membrane repeat protein
MTITQSTISGNYSGNPATDGAGIANAGGGVMTMISSTVSNNTSDGGGGGIGNVVGSRLIITASTISGNHANDALSSGDGGGIRNSATLTITNSTISGNTAARNGGGLYSNGTVDLNNVTITDNHADEDNNGTGNGGGTQGSMNMKNTIIAGNIDKGNERPDCTGGPTSLGYNLIGKSDGCGFSPTTGDQQGSIATPLNPKLGALANNGGPTQTHALLLGSPAINTANNATCASTDQRGISRLTTGTTCDIGAYEAPVTIFLPLIMR